MAGEEPKFRVDVQFGYDFTFAMFAAFGADMGNTIHHQHIRQGQAGIAGTEHFAVSAVQEFFKGV